MFTSDLGFCIANIIFFYWKSEKNVDKDSREYGNLYK